MPNFKSYDYSQSSMVVINFEDQLQPGMAYVGRFYCFGRAAMRCG